MPTADSQLETAPPTISVVICAYTDERLELLAAGIESLRSQTVAPHEIVLVVDHAPELEAIARERWPEAMVLANREQQGLSGARNTGVEACTGEVVAFLDDDATPAPTWIERLGAAYADPNVLGAGGSVRPRWETARAGLVPARVRLGRRLHPLGDAAAESRRCATWSAPTCPSAARR